MFPYPFSFLGTTESGLDQLDNNYYMEFDGVDDKVIPNFLATGQTEISVSAWVNSDSIGARQCVFGTVWAGSTAFVFGVDDVGKLYIFLRNGGANPGFLEANSTLSASTWYHVAVTLTPNGSNMDCTFYLNGNIDNTTGAAQAYGQGDSVVSTLNYEIGATGNYGGASYDFFEGKIDEVGIWDVVLSSSDITEIYNATDIAGKKCADLSALTTPPIAWYRMGD
mgnify:CR=1 FL=1|tara:strand:- start:3038 stop:3706 length:669 start_codon:yes stop_codon:yes gene_type:complete